MCFNAPISFSTFLIELFISLYLYNRNKNYDRMNSIFILSFALIQLWEGGIWENQQASFVALIFLSLWLQPIAQFYGSYIVTQMPFLKYFTYFYLITFVFILYKTFTSEFSVVTGPNHHLVWLRNNSTNFFNSSFLIFIYFFGLLFPLIYTKQWILLIVGLFTLFYSLYNYLKSNETSTFWCYSAIIYSIVAIFS
jgi:hypothetical protein